MSPDTPSLAVFPRLLWGMRQLKALLIRLVILDEHMYTRRQYAGRIYTTGLRETPRTGALVIVGRRQHLPPGSRRRVAATRRQPSGDCRPEWVWPSPIKRHDMGSLVNRHSSLFTACTVTITTQGRTDGATTCLL